MRSNIHREKWLNYLQTVETLIRRRFLRHLIWVYTVCQLPFYGSPDYNVLKEDWIHLLNFTPFLWRTTFFVTSWHTIWSSSVTWIKTLWYILWPWAWTLYDIILWSQPRWLVRFVSDWWSGGCGLDPSQVWQHSFVEIDHEIFSTVVLSGPLIQEGQFSVSGEWMCTNTG